MDGTKTTVRGMSDGENASLPTMRVICAWCRCIIVEGDAGAPVSYGMCHPCYNRLLGELKAQIHVGGH